MILRWVALAAAWATAMICAISCWVIQSRMLDEVNARLPDNARISPYGWYATKYMRLLGEYRRFYPSGRRLRQLRLLSMAMFLSMACAVLAIGFGFLAAAWLTIGGCTMMWLVHRNWQAR